MKKLALIFALFLVSIQLNSQSNFQRYYGGSGTEESYAVTITSDGGYAIAGTTTSFGAGNTDYFILKLDGSGNIVWQKTYGGSNADIGFSVSMTQTPDSGFVLTGSTQSFGSSGYDMYLLKVDKNGNMLWNKKYNSNQSGSSFDHGRGLLITANFDVIIPGSDASFVFGTSEALLMRVDNNGNLKWKKAYGGNGNDHFLQALELPGGNIMISGSTESFGAGSNDDAYLVKVDPNGNPILGYMYGNSGSQSFVGCDLTKELGLINVGFTDGSGVGLSDILLIKTDSVGTLKWAKTYGGSNNDIGVCVKSLGDGSGFLVLGTTESYGAGGKDILLFMTDTLGNVIWSKTFGSPLTELLGTSGNSSLKLTSNNGFVFTGSSNGLSVAGGYDAFLVKGDNLGSILCSNVNLSVGNPNFIRNTATPPSANVGIYSDIISTVTVSSMIDSAMCYCVPDSICDGCIPAIASFGGTSICLNDTSHFSIASGSAIDSVKWNFGDSQTSSLQNPTHVYASAGTFSVTVIVYKSCGNDTLRQTLTIHPLPNPVITLNMPSPFCMGVGALGSNYPTGVQWLFNGVSIPGATSQAYYPDSSGNYTLMITNINGCSAVSAAETVVVLSVTGQINYGEADSICVGETVDLTAPIFISYQWSTGDTTQEITISPFFTTVYTVTVTNANGCTGILSQTIKVNPVPTKPLISKVGSVLTSSFANTYQWRKNGFYIPGATAMTYTVISTGYYSVIVANQYNCSSESDTVNMNIVSVNDISSIKEFNVFPNPVKEQLTVRINIQETGNAAIVIYNFLGQPVLSKGQIFTYGDNILNINTSSFAQGLYILEVKTDSGASLQQTFSKE